MAGDLADPQLTCVSCNRRYPPRPGRGKQSAYCDECRGRRRRTMTQVRQLRMATTITNEWIEALGPMIIRMKEDLSQKQDGRCSRCDRRRRLYFAQDPTEQPTLVCSDCHERWTAERRSNVPNRHAGA